MSYSVIDGLVIVSYIVDWHRDIYSHSCVNTTVVMYADWTIHT